MAEERHCVARLCSHRNPCRTVHVGDMRAPRHEDHQLGLGRYGPQRHQRDWHWPLRDASGGRCPVVFRLGKSLGHDHLALSPVQAWPETCPSPGYNSVVAIVPPAPSQVAVPAVVAVHMRWSLFAGLILLTTVAGAQ